MAPASPPLGPLQPKLYNIRGKGQHLGLNDGYRPYEHGVRQRAFGRILLGILVTLLIICTGVRVSDSSLAYMLFKHYGISGSLNAGTGPVHTPVNGQAAVFKWTNHIPSAELNWTRCYEDYQCARLSVPLDYSAPLGETAAIALIKSASKYSPGDKQYRGPILFNPGGPGGSGISALLGRASLFREILGEGFDLIGFDPRGVGHTSPFVSAFSTSVEAGAFFIGEKGNINVSTSALGDSVAQGRILERLIVDRARRAAEHVSTPTVARDMMSIVHAAGQEKLQYWGFSYGTVLGATFAALFPDNVGRVVIDGVVDSENYFADLWSNNLRDTDAALLDIFQSCVEAGPAKCALFENSTALVQARVDRILNGLRTQPVMVYDPSPEPYGDTYGTVDFSLAKYVVFSVLYRTHAIGAHLVDALAALERGNGSAVYALSQRRGLDALMACDCATPGEQGETAPSGGREAGVSIACGDVVGGHESLDELRLGYEEMAETSTFADTWLSRSRCSGWDFRAKDRFNGTFEKATSFPLLLIGNVADPVTPLWNAHKMSKGFKDSVVLTQNSSGHCSISATSLCTVRAIRAYFQDGTLPEAGTVCETESSIFGGGLSVNTNALNEEDRRLLQASQMLQESYFVPALGKPYA
ncbi:hypothetical protein M0805_008019 [Coniferiporia weirii]|nr:hypothetical protein M0805_008019 [Coniferiporia weirii]